MKKNIQISNYALGQRYCPYFEPINDYVPSKTDYDLTDPAETGQYFHDCIYRLLNGMPTLKLNWNIERDAYQAVTWLKNTYSSGECYAERELHLNILDADVVGKPDLFILTEDNELTVIDFKYSNTENDNYYTALLLYLLLIFRTVHTFDYSIIKKINLVIKYKNNVKTSTLSPDLAKKLITQEENKLKNYINNTNYVTCQKCLSCKNCGCCKHCQNECFRYAAEAGPAAGKQQMLFCQQVINRKFQNYKENNEFEKTSYKAYPQNKDTINKIAELVEKKAAETGEKPKITKYISKSEAEKYLTEKELEKYLETKQKGPSPVCPWDK